MLLTILDTARKFPRFTVPEQTELLAMVGYSRTQSADALKKLEISGALAIATTVFAYAFVGASAVGALENPNLLPNMGELVVASYLTHYGSLLAVGHLNNQLLNNPSIRTSPSIFATSVH